MSYSDIGKQAKDFFGKKSGLSQAKSFTMKAKTSSGVSLKSETKLGKSAKLNAKFKQSGINFSKIEIVSDGKVVMLPKVIDSKLIYFIKNNIDLIEKSTNYLEFLDLRNFHNKTIRLK